MPRTFTFRHPCLRLGLGLTLSHELLARILHNLVFPYHSSEGAKTFKGPGRVGLSELVMLG